MKRQGESSPASGTLLARRGALEATRISAKEDRIPPVSHAGLWFERYLPAQPLKGISIDKQDGSPYVNLIKQVAAITDTIRANNDHPYHHFYKRWQEGINATAFVEQRQYKTRGPLAIGLGDESIIETAITLHHTYGVPFIPGSALKGLTARYVRDKANAAGSKQWGTYEKNGKGTEFVAGEAYTCLFGDVENAGYVTFFDALPMPDTVTIRQDVMTVHHRGYYGETKDGTGDIVPPADWDSPNPVPFLSATGTFLIALAGPPKWVNFTWSALTSALDSYGVGAKTSSGYGRLKYP